MERRRPTYDLSAIKEALGSVATLSMTRSALMDATALGFNRVAIVAAIVSIEKKMFYKSMTTHADNRVWQDVYHVPSGELVLYVKFQANAVTEFNLVSFKEK